MDKTMIYELLMKAKKNEIANLCAGILNLLNHRMIYTKMIVIVQVGMIVVLLFLIFMNLNYII